MKKWRLGLDMGTNSIGWAAFELGPDDKPCGLIDAGVRIFSDGRNPKDGQSNAVARRMPRQMRRNRDRYLQRREKFMHLLTEHGLMPQDESGRKELEKLDPWELRVRGLDEKLPLHHLGRALFHLQQRRGFKSNRKTDAGDDDSNKISSAEKELKEAMKTEGARTPGEYLALRRRPGSKDDFRQAVDAEMERCGKSHLTGNQRKKAKNKIRKRLAAEMGVSRFDHAGAEQPPARVRLRERLNEKGKKETYYDFYPTRALVEDEFNALWNAQAQAKFHGAALKDTAKEALLDTILFQRPLKAQPVGKCTLDPKDKRAPRALPSAQRLRIYQEINHMEVRLPGQGARKLTSDERDMLVDKALNTGKLTFDAARKALKFPEDAVFNLESERRKDLKGDETAAVLAAAKVWGKSWRALNLSDQDAAVENLLEAQDEEKLIKWLMETHGLEREIAEAAAKVNLPPGHGNLGRTAAGKVLAELKAADVPTYSEAVERAGYGSHSDFDDGEVFDQLPYYGKVLERHVAFGTGDHSHQPEKRFGKIANPTVHVALNQLRRTVNALMKEHGAPKQIVVELARNLPLSAVGKSELQKTQNDNKAKNDARRATLAEHGQRDSYNNRMRLRLWEELNPKDAMDRRCPYTGKQIDDIKRLFSADFEIEHVLPFSKTLDDSANNKTIAHRAANRQKGDRPPYEVFSDTPGYQDRVDKMLREKRWRFGPDAMTRFDDKGGFLARHLNDTKYLSRISTAYLKRTGAVVWVTPGRLTADLRWAWGLDSVLRGHNQPQEEDSAAKKNRDDHRHHAIDAVVVGLTDRGLLNEVARTAGQAEKNFDKRHLAGLAEPWADFRETVRGRIDKIVVSHKPDHGAQGALHNDTAYGIAEGPDKKGRSVVVHRVPLSGMKKAADLDLVRDEIIKKHLQTATAGLTGKEFTNALVAAGEQMTPPVRKVRICETISVIPIADPKHHGEKPYKAYKGDANYCYDIWANEKGKWTGEVVSRFDSNQPGFDPKAEQGRGGQPLVMRLRINDMLSIKKESAPRQIMRVVKISEGQIALAGHFEANVDARDRSKEDNFSYTRCVPSTLQKLKARLVRVDPAGRVIRGV